MASLAFWLLLLGVLAAFFVRGWRAERRAQRAFEEAMRRYRAGEFVRNHPAYGPDGKPWPWEGKEG